MPFFAASTRGGKPSPHVSIYGRVELWRNGSSSCTHIISLSCVHGLDDLVQETEVQILVEVENGLLEEEPGLKCEWR